MGNCHCHHDGGFFSVASVSIARDLPSRAWVMSPAGLLLRDGPSRRNASILLIPFLAEITVIADVGAREAIDGIAAGWHRASFSGKTGYIFGGFLSYERPKRSVPEHVPIIQAYFKSIRSGYCHHRPEITLGMPESTVIAILGAPRISDAWMGANAISYSRFTLIIVLAHNNPAQPVSGFMYDLKTECIILEELVIALGKPKEISFNGHDQCWDILYGRIRFSAEELNGFITGMIVH